MAEAINIDVSFEYRREKRLFIPEKITAPVGSTINWRVQFDPFDFDFPPFSYSLLFEIYFDGASPFKWNNSRFQLITLEPIRIYPNYSFDLASDVAEKPNEPDDPNGYKYGIRVTRIPLDRGEDRTKLADEDPYLRITNS